MPDQVTAGTCALELSQVVMEAQRDLGKQNGCFGNSRQLATADRHWLAKDQKTPVVTSEPLLVAITVMWKLPGMVATVIGESLGSSQGQGISGKGAGFFPLVLQLRTNSQCQVIFNEIHSVLYFMWTGTLLTWQWGGVLEGEYVSLAGMRMLKSNRWWTYVTDHL